MTPPLYIADAVRAALPFEWMRRRISALIITPYDLDTYLIRISIAVMMDGQDIDLTLAAAAAQEQARAIGEGRPTVDIDHTAIPQGLTLTGMERFPDVLCFARRCPEDGGQLRKLHAYIGAVDVARFTRDGYLGWIVKPQIIEIMVGGKPALYATVPALAHMEQRYGSDVQADVEAGRYDARKWRGQWLTRLDEQERPILTPGWTRPAPKQRLQCRLAGLREYEFKRAKVQLGRLGGRFDERNRTWTVNVSVDEQAKLAGWGVQFLPGTPA